MQELTAQVVALTCQVQALTGRLRAAKENAIIQTHQSSMRGGDSGIFDKKKLCQCDLKEAGFFRSWSDRFLAWIAMDKEEISQALKRAGKQEDPLDVTGLTPMQAAYSKAIYGHLRALTEGFRNAAKIVRFVKDENGLEAWPRRFLMSRRATQQIQKKPWRDLEIRGPQFLICVLLVHEFGCTLKQLLFKGVNLTRWQWAAPFPWTQVLLKRRWSLRMPTQ